MKYMLPNISMAVRIMPRTNWEMKFCTWVMSLVTRVTREPAPSRSTWGKEKVMIRRKQSLRISLPMFCPALCTNTLFIDPQKPPNSTSPTICSPSRQISVRSPAPPLFSPSTPSSTIRLMMPGWIRSISTSPTMQAAASTAKCRYRRT